MDKVNIQRIVDSYNLHKNLKIVGKDLGIPWQTVYWHLKRSGVEVVGDKEQYGTKLDRLGIVGEKLFSKSLPDAENCNVSKYQNKYDFLYKGFSIDIKTSTLKTVKSRKGTTSQRWAFSFGSQPEVDFLVFYCINGNLDSYTLAHTLLIPRDMLGISATLSVTKDSSKWLDFEVTEEQLIKFFNDL